MGEITIDFRMNNQYVSAMQQLGARPFACVL
jgi:hypothetical protein